MSKEFYIAGGVLTLGAAGFLWWYYHYVKAQTSAPLINPDGSLTSTADPAAIGSSVLDTIAMTAHSITGTVPRGIRNNNPLNLRYIDPAHAWNGQVGNDGGYGVYDSPESGIRAGSKQLQKDYSVGNDNTLRALITSWAPPTENNTDAYITDVASQTGLDPDTLLDLNSNLPVIVAAMIYHENGQQPYAISDLQTWVYE